MSDELVKAATEARTRSYAPYSKFHVGAAVSAGGKIYRGANVENASYGLCICAERNAIMAAVLAGESRVDACTVVTDSSPPAAPCGMCLQTLREFTRAPESLQVSLVNLAGEQRKYTLAELLPQGFAPEDLEEMTTVVLRGGTILTLDPDAPHATGDVVSVDGALTQVGGTATIPPGAEVLDASGCVVMPGLVQSHIHTCQTLARGRADDLALLDWLERVVWPYEAALGREDVACAARLATAELLLGGTTAIQDMGTVHHTDAAFEVLAASGIRAVAGKAMMDAGDRVPAGLRETTAGSLADSVALCQRWQGAASGRIGYAFAPRFVLSCSEGLLRETVGEARRLGARIHTHASENRDELAAVRKERGDDNVAYLDTVGMTGPDVGLAHCVWLSAAEKTLLARTRTRLLHCPSSNLKLASGVAEIPELIAAGVSVSLGADGAPCNNNLDGFLELRLAALLHKPRAGSRAMPAALALALATRGGAEALGLDRVGTLVVGQRADVIAVEIDTPHAAPTASPESAVVYACRSSDVRHVVVDGIARVRHKELLGVDLGALVAESRTRATRVFAGL